MNIFAQATNVPTNGASNAEDFQPPTRNPQTAPGDLQKGNGPQSTSGQDVLSNENARIVVPVNNRDEAPKPPAVTNAGINWFLVIAVAAVIVVAAEYFFRRRDKSTVNQLQAVADTQETMTLPTEEPEVQIESEVTEPTPEPPQAPVSKKKSSKTPAKKKSKSKRKKSRK